MYGISGNVTELPEIKDCQEIACNPPVRLAEERCSSLNKTFGLTKFDF